MRKLIVAFSNFARANKNELLSTLCHVNILLSDHTLSSLEERLTLQYPTSSLYMKVLPCQCHFSSDGQYLAMFNYAQCEQPVIHVISNRFSGHTCIFGYSLS